MPSKNKEYIEPGSAIRGDKIIGKARDISDKSIITDSSRHRAQQVILKRNAYCVIDKPLKMFERKFQLK